MGKRKARIKQAPIVLHFAARLRELRLQQSLTQAELARRATCALSHLSKLENGDAAPGLDLLDRLATALGTTVTRLLPAEDDAAAVEQLRERVRERFEEVVQRADLDVLNTLTIQLARL